MRLNEQATSPASFGRQFDNFSRFSSRFSSLLHRLIMKVLHSCMLLFPYLFLFGDGITQSVATQKHTHFCKETNAYMCVEKFTQ